MTRNSKKTHILVISQYFYPEQFRINDICTEWIKRGCKVTVVTGIPNYPQGKYYEGYGLFKKRKENFNGIEIIRIPIIPRGNNVIKLLLNYLSFVVSGFLWNVFTIINADYVFIFEVSPMTQALPGVWYARKRKIPCYLYVTDLWPENVEFVGGITNKTILNVIGVMVDYIYKRCDRIFTSSKSFINAINTRGVELGKLEFWPQYAEDYYLPVNREIANAPEILKDGSFNIIFTGNIGFAQGLHILPRVAQILKKNNVKIRFNMVGEGRFKDNLVNLVKSYDVADMFSFISQKPASRIPDYIAVCDAGLICLSKGKVFSLTLPAKMQSYLACGIPIIASVDGEIQDIINEARAGIYCDAGDAEKMALKIRELALSPRDDLIQMSKNAYEYSKKYFNKEKLLLKMDKYFNRNLNLDGEGQRSV